MEKVKDFYHHSSSYFHCRLKKTSSAFIHIYIFFPLFLFLSPRSGVAMPFGCLTIGEKKDYNNPSDVTDKYDLGQIVKSWVSQAAASARASWIKPRLPSLRGLRFVQPCEILPFREEFCEIFRAKDRTTMKMYTCKKFLKKDGRKVRKAAKNEILILKMWVFFYFLFFFWIGSCSLQLQHLCDKCLALIPSFFFYLIYFSVYTSGSPSSPAATTGTILQGVTELISIF